MGRLSGKTILVTGAASGIGRAALDLFAREGASLVAVDREERLLAEAVAALEAEAIAVVADVSDPKAVEAVFAEALEEFGRLHGVAHFAGVAHSALSWNLPSEAWEKVLRVNLTGSFLVARKAGEVLEEGEAWSSRAPWPAWAPSASPTTPPASWAWWAWPAPWPWSSPVRASGSTSSSPASSKPP